MAKIFLELNKSDFATKKVSSNKTNTEYTIGGTGESYVGDPDILYNQVVFISDVHQIYTRGTKYGSNVDCNVQINSTTTKLTTVELEMLYSDLISGQMVICPNVSTRYTKVSDSAWLEETIGQLVDVFPISNYNINGQKCVWNTGSIDLSTKKIIVQYSRSGTKSKTNSNILSIGKDIANWTSNAGSNIHCYYTVDSTGSTKSLQVNLVPINTISGGVGDNTLQTTVTIDVDTIVFTLDAINGLRIMKTDMSTILYSKSVEEMSKYSDLFSGTNLQIGSQEGSVRGYGVYDIININNI